MAVRLDPYLAWRAFRDRRFLELLSRKPKGDGHPRFKSRDKDKDDDEKPIDEAALFSILVERKDANQPLIIQAHITPATRHLLELNDAYAAMHTNAVAQTYPRPRFQPGVVNGKGLRLLLEASKKLDEKCVNICRWELAQAGEPLLFGLASGLDALAKRRPAFKLPDDPFLELARYMVRQLKHTAKASGAQAGTGAALINRPLQVCVIDDGCNFASGKLVRDGHSVVQELLVQVTEKEALDDLDATCLYLPGLSAQSDGLKFTSLSGGLLGRRLVVRQFAESDAGQAPAPAKVQPAYLDCECQLWNGASRPPALTDEPGVYRACDYLYPTPSGRHGAAVLDLVANPSLQIADRPHPRPHTRRVHFVQLPVPIVLDTSGSSLSAHALTAIHDALHAAQDGDDVLVNLSFGNNSGPHDGSSMIECAIVELLKLYDGLPHAGGKRLILVLPAGNTHLLRNHAQGQARHAKPSTIDWKVLPDDDTDNFLEIWVPRNRSFTITVASPNGSPTSLKVVPADQGSGVFAPVGDVKSHSISGALIYTAEPPNAQHSALILLAISGSPALKQAYEKVKQLKPVRHAFKDWVEGFDFQLQGDADEYDFSPQNAHGVWQIKIAPEPGPDCLPWHAYAQRGDVAPLRRRSARGVFGRQSYIMDNDESHADPMFTLNGIATASHPRLFVVGAMERADGRLSPYSAAGPRVPPALDPARIPDADHCRVCGPCWVVPADESRRRHGLLVGGVLGGSHLRMSGTSMAAATITRHLWEYLQAGHSLECFWGPPPCEEPAPTKIPVEAPEYACDLHRGETHRILSRCRDGSL